VVYIREGTYAEAIIPEHSGTPEAPITFAAYPGETVILDGHDEVYWLIQLIDKRYIVFDGLQVQNPGDEWAHLEFSDHITFQNMYFTNTEIHDRNFQGINFRNSSYNRVLDSLLENWGAYLPDGDLSGNHIRITGTQEIGGYNLIQGNRFIRGAQGCILVNAPFNVIRDNVFDNEWQKGIYVGYFEGDIGGEPAGTVFDATRNLVEDNDFIRHGNSLHHHGGMGYEDSGVGSIFRRNRISNGDYRGAEMVAFDPYAYRSYQNHWYNNVMVNNGAEGVACLSTGIAGSSVPGSEYHSNVFKNNILYGNHETCTNSVNELGFNIDPDNIYPPDLSPPMYGLIIAGNILEDQRPEKCAENLKLNDNGYGDCYIYFQRLNQADAAWFESRYPQNFWDNRVDDPMFVLYDPQNGRFDFHLQPGSPAIDHGVDLTYTVSEGKGIILPVEDAWYFQDGYQGMIAPDTIMVGNQIAVIQSIDYEHNLITLDRILSWDSGTPVNLPFEGTGPDIGAFEWGAND
jgi:hypothetical protein